MSQEKPTPQNNDDHEQDTIELSNGRSVPKSVVDALRVLDEKWPGATLRMARPAIVAAVMDALHVDGYEITKQTEFGVTKGLAGLADELTRTIMDLEGSVMSEALAERIKSGNLLDPIAPGASEAAQQGIEIANRSIGFVSQKAAESAGGLMEHLDAVAAARFGIGPNSPKWLKDMTVAAALELIGKQPDVVAAKLPEPNSTRYEGPEHEPADRFGWWQDGNPFAVTQWGYPNQVQLAINNEPFEPLSSAQARFLAAALLAAAARADAAEGDAK